MRLCNKNTFNKVNEMSNENIRHFRINKYWMFVCFSCYVEINK